ncbi:LysR family transcriptional regulator [Pseudoxanthomonas sacheonensis]|uniref:DNA-binding transcriptional LysR family regulator n=1 Tax=Pseudoxanthomonas sacheonensis TaxID=443615 RepID=A0ABU1RPQ3_9GAMM|nr:LysR family transcriptional regulator [Pseudoxanthomonas sacheonensis]MDR6840745.1 DNA-binding transcriptional LysR family regulator [Pseudoxanthomonas sacheonensis]
MKTLDVAAVRAFALTAELQSFTRAADVLGTTQSAISLKLRRLEQQLGRRLLERTPRQVRLSAEGLVFLEAARELVAAHDRATAAFEVEPRRLAIGISQQLVGGELPALLRQLKDRDPALLIELRIAGTRELMQAYEQGEIDAALVLRPDDGRKRGRAVFAQSFSWFALPGWTPYAGQPLPLATQGESCRIRTMAVRALDKSGIAWSEVFIGKGGAAVGAAAAAGLAVALLAKSTAPVATVDVASNLALPPIPDQEVMLYSALNDSRSRDALRILTMAFR